MELDYSDEKTINYENAGQFPFTRGIHAGMYRTKLWTIRQYSGFGSARDTNSIFMKQIESGAKGLSIAFDLPTQLGLDSDDPKSVYDVCKVGVAIDSIEDMRALLANIDLQKTSISMTINSTALILIMMYKIVAEERGFELSTLSGTIQNDILKEFISRSTHIFEPEDSLFIAMSTVSYIQKNLPSWNPISISGYHMAEAGASPAEEIAFAICNALEYIRWAKSAEINVERFLERISFFFCSRTNLLEEIAKFRAARRVWAKIVKSHFAYDESKQKMRFHTQTAGIQLEARNPEFNLIRVTIQALVAILGGSQSIHTNSFDEAISIPSEYSSLIAFETQKIIQRETDICQSIDPMGGSYVIENLTNQMEQHIFEIIHTIENMGGAMSAISAGYQKKVIETNAYNFAMQQETFSDKVFLRSNNARFAMLSEPISKEFTDSGLIIENLGKFKKSRNANLEDDLRRIQKSTRNSSNFFEDLEGAIRNGATIGEVISALKVSLTNP